MDKQTNSNREQKKLPRELITVHDFAECANIRKKEHTKTKVAIYCQTCKRFHHLHFGEFKRGLSEAKCLQDIIDKYAWKYCYRGSDYFKLNINQGVEETEEAKTARMIEDKIQKLSGDKIVTITLSYDNGSLVETFQYHIVGDLSKETQEEKMVRTFFMHNKIKWGLEKNNHAGIVVRQITGLQTLVNDKMKNVYRVYGIAVGSGSYKFLNKKEIELAYTVDARTGKPLPVEENIIFEEFF